MRPIPSGTSLKVDGSAASKVEPLHLVDAEESDRLAVRRPEERPRAFGSRERSRLDSRRAAAARFSAHPSHRAAMYASCDPSGDKAMQSVSTVSLKAPLGGGAIWNRTGEDDDDAARPGRIHAIAAARSATPANVQGSHRRARGTSRNAAATPAVRAPLRANDFSCNPTSCAVCQRSSGSFARQVRTSRSSSRRNPRRRSTTSAAGRRGRIARRPARPGSRAANAFCPVDHLVEHGAEREDVGARVGRACPRAARAPCTAGCRGSCPAAVRSRPASCRPCRQPRRRTRRRRDGFGEAEVEQLHARRASASRCPASSRDGRCRAGARVERVGDLDAEAQRLVERQRPSRQPRRERLALEQFHHEKLDHSESSGRLLGIGRCRRHRARRCGDARAARSSALRARSARGSQARMRDGRRGP